MSTENVRFKQVRKDLLHKTQESFAEDLDISVSTVAAIEQGKNKLSADIAIKIHDKFGYSLDYLYGLTEDSNDTASTMLLYLTNLFDYHIDAECKKYPHILSIKKSVIAFLQGYAQANELLHNQIIPESAYTPWINKLKKDLNSDIAEDRHEQNIEFCLVPKIDLVKFLKIVERDKCELIDRTIRDKGIKFSSDAAKRDFIRNADEYVTVIDGNLCGFDDYLSNQQKVDPAQFLPDKPIPQFVIPVGLGGDLTSDTPQQEKKNPLRRH